MRSDCTIVDRWSTLIVFYWAVSGVTSSSVCGQGNENAISALEDAVSAAVGRAEESVVAIARGPKAEAGPEDIDEPFSAEEYGTGVVIDASGLVLTNYHLLGDPTQSRYAVTILGKEYFPAKIKAADPWTDLAVLEFEATDLTPIQIAPNAKLRKGKFVVALGNPYGIRAEGSPSAAFGIISNLAKLKRSNNEESKTIHQHGQLIQTDTKSMAGSSGGPLVDLQGRMIGLMTSVQAIAGYDQAGSYATHIDQRILRIIERLKQGQAPEFGFLGVNPIDLSDPEGESSQAGVKIGESNVFRHTPAAKAGLQLHDIITHFAGTLVLDADHLVRLVSFSEPSEKIQIAVRRADPFLRRTRTVTREVSLAKRPSSVDRISISTKMRPDWRGIRVDFATVSNEFYELANRLPIEGAVLVVSVRRESIGWNAGLRAGDLIAQIDGVRVESPAAFLSAIGDSHGEVECEVIHRNGARQVVTIPAVVP